MGIYKKIGEICKLQGTTHANIEHRYKEVNRQEDNMGNEAFMQQEGIQWII